MSKNNNKIAYARLRTGEWENKPAAQQPNDAGFDLVVSRDVTIYPGAMAQVPTNIAAAIPPNLWGMLVGRSSTFSKRGLDVRLGVIDSGYRGEIMAVVHNIGPKRVLVRAGDRIFQLILIPRMVCEWIRVRQDKLPASVRGTAGFGSTGGLGEQEQGTGTGTGAATPEPEPATPQDAK